MAVIAAIAAGASQAVKAFQKEKLKIAETKGLREAKDRAMAATTREMAEEERNKEYMHSRALALSAFSGGGVNDPGMVKVLADLSAEGEYRVMSKLWSGQNEAEGIIYRSEVAKREGDAVMEAMPLNVVSSAMSAYSGMGG